MTGQWSVAEVSAHPPQAVIASPVVRDLQRRLREIRRVERALGAADQQPMPDGDLARDAQHLEAQIRATAARIEQLNDEQKEKVWKRIQDQHLEEADATPRVEQSGQSRPPVGKHDLQVLALDKIEKRAQDILFQSQAADKARQEGVAVRSNNPQGQPNASVQFGESAALPRLAGDRAMANPQSQSMSGLQGKNTDGAGEGHEVPAWLHFGNLDRRQYAGRIESPKVTESGRLGHARMLGVSGPFMRRLHIDAWYVLGPFPGHGPQAIELPLPVESSLLRDPDLEQTYQGKDGKRLRWQWQPVTRYPMVPLGAEEYAVHYSFTEILSESEQEVMLHLGADDDARVWLNGIQVWASGSAFKPWYRGHFSNLKESVAQFNLSESTVKVRLRAGKNQLAFKLYNGYSATFISVVLGRADP